MIENLKTLVSVMDSKTDFVTEVCNYYGTSHKATLQNWFQGYWSIPEDKLPKVVEMAQNYLYQQNQRQLKVLKESGFDLNDSEVVEPEEIK